MANPKDNPKDKSPKAQVTSSREPLSKEQIERITNLINEMDERMSGFTLGQVLSDLTGLTDQEMALITTEYIQRIRERGDNVASLLSHMVLIGAWAGIRHITRVMKGRAS